MQFLYPTFLFALGLIAIPILIHLFNFRKYKKVFFSDIRFLQQLTEQTKKQQKLKERLILLCRVLLITFLVLAFAQPFLPSSKKKAPLAATYIAIYLDNSFSMNANGDNGNLLVMAKQKAINIVNAFPDKQVFQFLNNDFEGKYLRTLNKSEVIEAIQSTEISPAHRSLQSIYNRQKSMGEQIGMARGDLYWISDFQRNMGPLPINKSSEIGIHILSLAASKSQNVWIDTAYFASPILKMGGQNKLQVVIKNEGDIDFENQPLVLKINGIQKLIQNVSCKAKQKTSHSLFFTLPDYNWHAMSVSLTDYPIVFDDEYYLAAKAQQSLNVLCIQDEVKNASLSKVFVLDTLYNYQETNIQQIDFNNLSQQALVILNEPKSISSGLADELIKYVQSGGVLFFIPAITPRDFKSIQQFLEQAGLALNNYQTVGMEVGEIETKDPLFAQVFSSIPSFTNLPQVTGYWQLTAKTPNYRSILSLKNQAPFLVRTKLKKGSFFALSASLQPMFNSLVKHPLFVPIMLNLPLQRNKPQQASFLLGEKAGFHLPLINSEKLLRIEKEAESHLVSVQFRDGLAFGNLNGQIKASGVYEVKSGNLSVGKLAFNYNRSESPQGFISPEVLIKELPASMVNNDLTVFKQQMVQSQIDHQYWKLALALALFFLLAEFALLSWWK
jgi:hypothetical protein